VPDDGFCIKITLQFLQCLPIDRESPLTLVREFEYSGNAHVVVKEFAELGVGGPVMLSVWTDLELKADAFADYAVELLGKLDGFGTVLPEQILPSIFVNPQPARIHFENRSLKRAGEVVCRSCLGAELREEFV
jgi:hypothetical protein